MAATTRLSKSLASKPHAQRTWYRYGDVLPPGSRRKNNLRACFHTLNNCLKECGLPELTTEGGRLLIDTFGLDVPGKIFTEYQCSHRNGMKIDDWCRSTTKRERETGCCLYDNHKEERPNARTVNTQRNRWLVMRGHKITQKVEQQNSQKGLHHWLQLKNTPHSKLNSLYTVKSARTMQAIRRSCGVYPEEMKKGLNIDEDSRKDRLTSGNYLIKKFGSIGNRGGFNHLWNKIAWGDESKKIEIQGIHY